MTHPSYEKKVWGEVRHTFDGPVSTSLLRVESDSWSSLHYHKKRHNHFFVISGKLLIEYVEHPDDVAVDCISLTAGGSVTIPAGVWHRFRVLEAGRLAEVYWTEDGSDAEYDDIVRHDQGGRL